MFEDKLNLILKCFESINRVVLLLLDDRISEISEEIRLAELRAGPTVELATGETVNRRAWIEEQEQERNRWVGIVNNANEQLSELRRLVR